MVLNKSVIALMAFSLTIASVDAASKEAVTDAGKVRGSVLGDVLSFKGIPFAAPPVGNLRWRPPQPPAKWSNVRDATHYGSDCMQNPFPGDAAPLGEQPAEDCLVMNVWAPSRPTAAKLPVMVWFYGGGFVNGGSSPAVYDGSQFAKQGIVFVSFNYRVGRFGFFAHPALTEEAASKGEAIGNYAFMDQIAALQWVKRNIGQFGGDANRVTIFGESAGGISIFTMMTSPAAKGLFQRAMIESGGGRAALGLRPLRRSTPEVTSAEAVGVAFAKSVGITDTGAAALSRLRQLSAVDVTAGLNMAAMDVATYAGPILDEKIAVTSEQAAFSAGTQAKVPLLIGANSQDIWPLAAKTKAEFFAQFGTAAPQARKAYDPTGNTDLKTLNAMAGGDKLMVEPARFAARQQAATGQPTYEYRFSYVAKSLRAKEAGAPHATEIPYVFDTLKARYGNAMTAEDQATAKAVHDYWTAFVKTGDPNGEGRPHWPQFDAKSDRLMDFCPGGPQAKPDPWKNRLDVTEAQAKKK